MSERRADLLALALVGAWVVQQAASDALVWDLVGWFCAVAAVGVLVWRWRVSRGER
jgi:threonine/homoserine efflux transporter RhtA